MYPSPTDPIAAAVWRIHRTDRPRRHRRRRPLSRPGRNLRHRPVRRRSLPGRAAVTKYIPAGDPPAPVIF